PLAITATPTARAITGARNESFVPAARPAARPATTRGHRRAAFLAPPGSLSWGSAGGAQVLTRIATAHRTNATPTMSLSASPAWTSTRVWGPRASAAPI